MRRKPVLAVAGIGAIALTAAACGSSGGGGGGGNGGGGGGKNASYTLTIGDLIPETGDLAIFGPPGRVAATIAQKKLNHALKAAGSGITVKITTQDTQTEPQASVTAARKVISDGATCYAGAWASADTIPTGKSVAARQQIPQISPASTSAKITKLKDNGYLFRTAPSDLLQGKALSQVIAKKIGGAKGKTISLAARNDAYGTGFIDRVKQVWTGMGGKVQGPVEYDPKAESYDSEAQKIVSGNPAAYVIIDFPETYAKVGAALVRTGKFDTNKMYTADGLAADTIPKGIPDKALNGANGTRPGTPSSTQAAKEFNKLFQQNAPGNVHRATFDAQNYDAITMCGLASIAAKSKDAKAIRDKLTPVSGPPGKQYNITDIDGAVKALLAGKKINYQGVSGPVDFDSHGDPSTAYYDQYKYVHNKLKVIRTFKASEH